MASIAPPDAPRAVAPDIQAETLDLLDWPRLCQHLATFAATKLGAIAARRLKLPDRQADSETLLAQTREAYLLELRLEAGLPFGGIADIGSALERADRQGVLSGEELVDLANTLAGARQLRRAIDAQDDLTVLPALVAELRTYPELEQEIHRCLDETGRVQDRASPKLGDLRQRLRQTRDSIYQKLQQLMQQRGSAIQEPTIVQRGDRFVLPVKATHKDALRGIVHDASASGSTLYIEPHATVEANNRLRQLQRQEAAECEVVRRSLTEQVAEVLPDLERLLAICTALDLAAARARYGLWLEANPPRFSEGANEPPEAIVLRQLRHPLLVWQHRHENGPAVVPVDATIDPHTRVVAITGPNTGGKTVTLKTLGLAALMARAGLFVPAKEPVELPWFGQVLADIGDEQSLEQSLSTFSGHIKRIARILAALPEAIAPAPTEPADPAAAQLAALEASVSDAEPASAEPASAEPPTSEAPNPDPSASQLSEPQLSDRGLLDLERFNPERFAAGDASRSPEPRGAALVLLDEVGAGTDPAEGSALAAALLTALADRARLTVATTHFGELKTLKYQDDRFENASVEFDDRTLSPTYRLLWGIPGRSNALAIARRLGLEGAIADAAARRIGGQSEDINRTIAGLEEQRRRQEAKANEVAHLLQRAEYLHEQIDRKAKTLKEREANLKQSQEQAVQQAIAQAKGEIAKVIRDLQRSGSPDDPRRAAQAARKATEQVDALGDRFLPSRQVKAKPKGYRPEPGERVRIPRLGGTAEVLAVDADDGELTVRMGLMKATVPFADVESLDGQKPEATKPEPKFARETARPSGASPPEDRPEDRPTARTSRNEIDLRGFRVADAERDIDAAIDRALSAGLGALWIIHGKGTGKLREGVHAHLKASGLVDRYELARQQDGGTGVTVAYLR